MAILVDGHPVAYSLARPSVSSLPDQQPKLLSEIRESRARGRTGFCCCRVLGRVDYYFIHSPMGGTQEVSLSLLFAIVFSVRTYYELHRVVSLEKKHNASLWTSNLALIPEFLSCPASRLHSKAISHSDSFGNMRRTHANSSRGGTKTRLKKKKQNRKRRTGMFGREIN